jgi:hypothetical protein
MWIMRGDKPLCMWGYNTHIHGKITRKLPVWLSLSQASKTVIFFFLSFLFCKTGEQKGRTCPVHGGGLASVEGEGGEERV